MVVGVMIYEDESCNVLVEKKDAESVMDLDHEFKTILDNKAGALIQLTYVDSTASTIINSGGFPS